jgi:hypothetical protein
MHAPTPLTPVKECILNPSETVIALLTAIAERREADALALVDKDVVWQPLARPGLTFYRGHSDFCLMIKDLHNAYGQMRVEINEIEATEVIGDIRVRVLATVIRETKEGDLPLPTSQIIYTLKNGLVTGMEANLYES